MNPKQRMIEVKAELKKLRASIATAKDDELDGIQEQITALETEKASLAKRIQMIDAATRAGIAEDGEDGDEGDDGEDGDEDDGGAPKARSMAMLGGEGVTPAERAAAELKKKRTAMGETWKKSTRTVVLDSTVLVPAKQGTNLAGFPFNQVSGILDAVNYLDVITGESYEEPYIVSTGEGDYTDQPDSSGNGGMYHEVDLDWDTAKIIKTKITAYSEITKELERTPAANYADAVEANVRTALRKKLAKEIVVGDGATGHFTGIMSSAVKSNTVNDYELGTINENTLDELILNYGGEEDIESTMAILVNKLTLLEFSRVRGSDKRKVYNINYENNTIDGIKFFTSSSVKGFGNATSGEAVLAYGDFNKYRVAVFSNIETAKSTDYKFRQGITAFRGDVFMGGNIIGYGAFIRVFKADASVTKLTKKLSV